MGQEKTMALKRKRGNAQNMNAQKSKSLTPKTVTPKTGIANAQNCLRPKVERPKAITPKTRTPTDGQPWVQSAGVEPASRDCAARIWIPGNCPSLKNSKVATQHGVFMSKSCRRYLQSLGIKGYSASKKTVDGYVKRPNLFAAAVRPVMGRYNRPQAMPVMVRFFLFVIHGAGLICSMPRKLPAICS